MIQTIISVLIGAVITWLVSWYYYKRAGDELKIEADKLKDINEMILRWLEVDENNIRVIRDIHGKPVSLARTADFTESVSASCDLVGLKIDKVEDAPSS